MNLSAHRTTLGVWGMLLLVLLLTGCRTYGTYNTREETLAKIRQSTERFAADLERARGELQVLQQAAASNAALKPSADLFGAVVAEHEALLARHEAEAEHASAGSNILFAWVGPDSYRRLHRGYSAMVTDERIIRERYDMVLAGLETAEGYPMTKPVVQELGRYQIAPQFYARLQNTSEERSVTSILSQPPPSTQAAPDEQAPDAPVEQ